MIHEELPSAHAGAVEEPQCNAHTHYLYRDLPRALMIGIPLVTICYLLTNIAYIAVVGGDGILASGAVAMVIFVLTLFVVINHVACFKGLSF